MAVSVMTDIQMAASPLAETNRKLFTRLIDHHIRFTLAKRRIQLSKHDWYVAAALVVRDMLVEKMLATRARFERANSKKLYYLSLEFLIGRSLGEQPLQPRHHRHLPRFPGRKWHRPANPLRRRTRRGAGQRRSRPARGLLSGFARDARYARLRLRHQLRVRSVPPGNSRRLPVGASRQLAARDLALAGRAARGVLHDSGLRPHRSSHRSQRRIHARLGRRRAC